MNTRLMRLSVSTYSILWESVEDSWRAAVLPSTLEALRSPWFYDQQRNVAQQDALASRVEKSRPSNFPLPHPLTWLPLTWCMHLGWVFLSQKILHRIVEWLHVNWFQTPSNWQARSSHVTVTELSLQNMKLAIRNFSKTPFSISFC